MQDFILFKNLLLKILPLYLITLIGYISGKFLEIDRKSIALVIMYTIAPVVFFTGIVHDNIPLTNLSISAFVFLTCVILASTFLGLGSLIWKDSTKNILALCSSSGNMGYFGIPVGLAIFGTKALGTLIMAMLGVIIFQNTVAYFIAANGKYSFIKSLQRTLLVPNIYAVALAFYLKSFIDFQNLKGFYAQVFDLAKDFTGTYSILGMLIVGFGLSGIKNITINNKTSLFLLLSLVAKFIAFPLLTYFFILIDISNFHLFNNRIYDILLMLSLAPIPANAVVIASTLKLNTDMISIAVLVSNIFALFLIPLILLAINNWGS